MIKYNNSDIIDWYFDESNIIKVYRNGAVVFYKFDSEQGGYKVCYAVVDDITQYQETEFEDVYDKATEKWYKLNNLSEYEEYGVYGSGRTSCEGSSRLPQGYTEVEYIRQNSNYNAYINTGVIPFDNTSNTYTITTRLTSEFHSNLGCATIIACENPVSTPAYYGLGYRYKCSETVDQFEFYGSYPNYSSSVVDNGDGTRTVTFQSTGSTSWTLNTPLIFFANWASISYDSINRPSDVTIYSSTVVKNGITVRDFVPAKRNSDSVYGLYDLINDVFYTSPNGNNFIGGDPIIPTDCVTTYEGKLTIDDGYEYEWNGSSWVNLGEVSGSSRVPIGYTEVEYISSEDISESVLGPYIDTNYKPTQNTRFVIEYQSTTNTKGYQRIFGSGEFDMLGYLVNIEGKIGTSGYYYYKFGQTSSWYTTNVQCDLNRHVIDYNNSKQFLLDNVSIATLPNTSFTCSSNLGIFWSINTKYTTNNINFIGRIFSAKVYENGILVRDFVPCISPNNGVGMYDIVNNVFYTSSNNYSFKAGEPITPTEYPKYYSEKSEPLDNLTFNTLEDAQAYAEANCVYVGLKAAINGNRYIFSGDSQSGYEWVENQHSLPDVPFVLNYNARQYNASTHTIPYTEGALNTIDAVITGATANIIDHSTDGYIELTGSTSTTIRARVGTTNFSRSSSSPNMTIICKAYTPGSSKEGSILSNRNENYNWMYRHKSSILTLHGTSEQGSIAVSNTEPNTCSIRIDSSRLLTYNNWTQNTTSTYSNFGYGSNSNGGALFSGYYSSTYEMWKGVFYWIYMSLNTLTDEQVQQVIDYNENL